MLSEACSLSRCDPDSEIPMGPLSFEFVPQSRRIVIGFRFPPPRVSIAFERHLPRLPQPPMYLSNISVSIVISGIASKHNRRTPGWGLPRKPASAPAPGEEGHSLVELAERGITAAATENGRRTHRVGCGVVTVDPAWRFNWCRFAMMSESSGLKLRNQLTRNPEQIARLGLAYRRYVPRC
jgi:hypothetical protein